jgi:hypothetical protein
MPSEPAPPLPDDDAPPFGRSWAPLYAVVIGVLVALVVVFALLTRAYE